MNNKFEKFIRDLEAIRLRQEEKDTLRRELAAFAYQYQKQVSPYQIFFVRMRQSAALALALLLVLGGASKGASAKALPGEILYPVKIIHEEIAAATKTKAEDKISYEIKRAETRIKEAAQLAKEEKLDSKKQEDLARDIQKHTQKVRSDIERVQENDPEQALALNSEMKTRLKVNSEALKQVTQKEEKEVSVKELATEDDNEEMVSEKEVPATELPINELDIALQPEENFDLLFDSLAKELTEVEAYEAQVSEQIILEKDIQETPTTEDLVLEKGDTATEDSVAKDLEQKIDYFEKVIKIEAEISEIKESLKTIQAKKKLSLQAANTSAVAPALSESIIQETVIDLAPEDRNQIQAIRKDVDLLVSEKKYGQAFLKLRTILEKYQEQLVGQQIEDELDVDLVADLSEEPTAQKELVKEQPQLPTSVPVSIPEEKKEL